MDVTGWFRMRSGRFRVAPAGITVVAALLFPVTTAFPDGENITVSCYRGDQSQGDYMGNVTVFAPETAGQSCNSLYYNCRGKCYGCFSDFDLSEDVCYDNTGKKFLR